jgi:hypothetical protein
MNTVTPSSTHATSSKAVASADRGPISRTVRQTGNGIPASFLGRRREVWITAFQPTTPALTLAA